jgi:hypothetical protein
MQLDLREPVEGLEVRFGRRHGRLPCAKVADADAIVLTSIAPDGPMAL